VDNDEIKVVFISTSSERNWWDVLFNSECMDGTFLTFGGGGRWEL
jgi:hypothetical protein